MEQISDVAGEIGVSSETHTHISAGRQPRGDPAALRSGETTPAKHLRVPRRGVGGGGSRRLMAVQSCRRVNAAGDFHKGLGRASENPRPAKGAPSTSARGSFPPREQPQGACGRRPFGPRRLQPPRAPQAVRKTGDVLCTATSPAEGKGRPCFPPGAAAAPTHLPQRRPGSLFPGCAWDFRAAGCTQVWG